MDCQSSELEEYRHRFEDGRLERSFYRNGKREGEYSFWNVDGRLIVSSFYKDGWKDGERKTWYGTGQIYTYEFHKQGIQQERKEWSRDGQLIEHWVYKDGEIKYKTWHDNGWPCMHESYKAEKLEGGRKEWYRSKELAVLEFYRNGCREGERKSWWVSGEIRMHSYWKDGGPIDTQFNWRKKWIFIKIKRLIRVRLHISAIDKFMISDMSRMIC